MPSSIDVSIMLLGDEVEDLRRTVGGGRGSIRQPFTLRAGGEKGERKEREKRTEKICCQSSQTSLHAHTQWMHTKGETHRYIFPLAPDIRRR